MVKCSICKNKVDTTFLNKIVGTYIKDAKGKKHAVCFECQSKIPDKDTILKEIK
jgi:hypothetical protein